MILGTAAKQIERRLKRVSPNNIKAVDYTLSPQQITNLELNARSVLGEDNYKMLGRFYDSILESRAEYKVVLARKCLNLLNVYYWCRKKEHPDNTKFSSLFYSDNTLISSIPKIAMSYVLFNRVPDILIIDDILIHGRTLNKLIDEFIDKLTDYLNYCDVNKKRQEVEADVLCFLKIKVMVQNDKPLLIKEEYYKRLELLDGRKSLREAAKWHDLSSRTSRLISENIFSNTSYALSMFETDKAFITNSARENGFACSAWNKRYIRDVWVKPLYRPDKSIAAIYTIRLTQNSIDGKFSAVPFVFTADFDIKYADDMYKRLGAELVESPYNTVGLAKMIPFLLSHNLLLLILQGYGKDINLDIDKIFCGIGNGSDTQAAFLKAANRTEPFYSWEEFDSLILKATESSEPLIAKFSAASKPFDEIIANEGEEIEKNAFLQYSGERNLKYHVHRKPITELFARIDSSTEEKLVESIGDVLRMTDTGSVAISSQKNSKDERYSLCVYRAGEQSQFIHPKKYIEELPVLFEMESDCIQETECECIIPKEDKREVELKKILERIRVMYGDNQKLCSELCDYTNMIYYSGQRLNDWNINYLSWAENDFERYPELERRSQEKRIILQMILNSVQKTEAIKKYRVLFPEQ